jgi:hypothetical protein
MQGRQSGQASFHAMIYEELIPADHLLRRLSAAVDFSFVSDPVSDCYCPDNGRPSCDPLVLFKAVFLQFLYDLSDRQVEDQVNPHLACKWFVGLQPEEAAPGWGRTSARRFSTASSPRRGIGVWQRWRYKCWSSACGQLQADGEAAGDGDRGSGMTQTPTTE